MLSGKKQTYQNLKNKDFKENTIKEEVKKVYETKKIESPGVDPKDITKTIIEAH